MIHHLASIVALSCVAFANAAFAEELTPKAAVLEFVRAIENGDVPAAMSAAVTEQDDREVIEAMAGLVAARRNLAKAMHEAFPTQSAPPVDTVAIFEKLLQAAEVVIKDDIATIAPKGDPGGVKMKKVGGVWKYDLRAQADYPALKNNLDARRRSIAAHESLAKEVAASKFASVEEARRAPVMRVSEANASTATSQPR